MKWLKIAYSNSMKKNTSIGVPLSSCVLYFDADFGGKISQVFVNDMACRLLIDKDGRLHHIADWECESIEELELQAMLNGCLFGLDDKDRVLMRAAADSMMARKLAKADAKAKALAEENTALTVRLGAAMDELRTFWDMASHAYKSFCRHGIDVSSLPDDSKQAWQDTRSALAALANADEKADRFSYWELGSTFGK